MAFLAGTASVRSPFTLVSSSRRRYELPTAVKATADSNSVSSHPLISSLRLAASAAVLLAATSPAIACTPSPPPPPALAVAVSPEDPVPDDSLFKKLILETAGRSLFGGAEAARARAYLSDARVGEQYDRLLAAQMLYVDGKVDEAIAAFEELAREGPGDYRPLFCQGVLYSFLGRAAETRSMLERCRVLTGDDFRGYFGMMKAEEQVERTETAAEAEKTDAICVALAAEAAKTETVAEAAKTETQAEAEKTESQAEADRL